MTSHLPTGAASQGGDDQLNCVGDALARDIPSWEDRLAPYVGDLAIFGGICEPYEYLWRIIGSENALLWMGLYPDLLAAFVDWARDHGHVRVSLDFEAANLYGSRFWLAPRRALDMR